MSIIERLTASPLILTDLDGTILQNGSILEELENLTKKLKNIGIK